MSELYSQDDYFISERYMYADDSSIVLNSGMYTIGDDVDLVIQNKKDSTGVYSIEYVILTDGKTQHQFHVNRYSNDSVVVWAYDIIKKRRRKEVCNTTVYCNNYKVVKGKTINDVMVGNWVQYDTTGSENGNIFFGRDMQIKSSENYDLIYEYVGKYYGIKSPHME